MAVNQAMRIAISIIDFSVLVMCVFCYFRTLREINAIDWSEFREAAEHRNAKVEERVARKVVAYVLIFVLQWVSWPFTSTSVPCILADLHLSLVACRAPGRRTRCHVDLYSHRLLHQ